MTAPAAMIAKVQEAERLLHAGRAEQALALAQRLLPKAPADPGLNSLLFTILLRMGRAEQAHFYAERAVAGAPEAADTHVNLAMSLQALGRAKDALASLRHAVQVGPDSARARLALANALLDESDAPGAIEQCRQGLRHGPDAQLSATYAGALLALGDIDESVRASRDALAVFPDESVIASGLALSMTYQYGADPEQIAAAHRNYGAVMDRTRPQHAVTTRKPRDPGKCLRIGIVSPDLRSHSVSFFIEPFFEHHDRAAFQIVAYSGTRHPDRVSERLRAHATLWRDTPNFNAMQLATRIQADGIDILIDLAGHTLGNDLPAFNLRPAPLQITYCGYPDTTGLSEMDFRIVDSCTDPDSPEVAARATERLWRLDPCFLCYRPPADAPLPTSRTNSHSGPTFGSFNAGRKLNPGIIAVWARILHATPGSRMLLKSFDFAAPGSAARVASLFASQGIGADRIEVIPATPTLAEHLALYSRVDVALDAAPYNGTTTTCEALWMGVPVVGLEGRTHAARVGVSLLSVIGTPELIALTETAYIELARSLATSPERLAQYRASLRSRMAASPLCDAPAFAKRFGSALRSMWTAACESS